MSVSICPCYRRQVSITRVGCAQPIDFYSAALIQFIGVKVALVVVIALPALYQCCVPRLVPVVGRLLSQRRQSFLMKLLTPALPEGGQSLAGAAPRCSISAGGAPGQAPQHSHGDAGAGSSVGAGTTVGVSGAVDPGARGTITVVPSPTASQHGQPTPQRLSLQSLAGVVFPVATAKLVFMVLLIAYPGMCAWYGGGGGGGGLEVCNLHC